VVEKMRMNAFQGTKPRDDPTRIRDRLSGEYRGVTKLSSRNTPRDTAPMLAMRVVATDGKSTISTTPENAGINFALRTSPRSSA